MRNRKMLTLEDKIEEIRKNIEERFGDMKVPDDHPVIKMIDKWIMDIKSPPTKVGSAEWKAKISAALKGRPAHNKGVPMSNEAKAKMSAAAKKRWKRIKTPVEHDHPAKGR